MANTVFKYRHQHQHHSHHSHPHHQRGGVGGGGSGVGIGASGNANNHNQNNNSNQNSIFVLNAETKITAGSCSKYYLDFNDNSVDDSCSANTALTSASCGGNGGNGGNGGGVSGGGSGTNGVGGYAASSSSSSVWSSASSTMCSPAAHAIQKLFNCSSGGGGGSSSSSSSAAASKQHGNYAGIDSKTFKTTKSELLKKKSKFWQYLEGGETVYEGIDAQKGKVKSSRKPKSKYWSKSFASDNQNSNSNNSDLSELLEYSCSLCDNCRCIDCQIGYFDCDNSDDSNSEYSFHMNGYDEDEGEVMELKHTTLHGTSITEATTTTSLHCGEPLQHGVTAGEESLDSLSTFRHNKMDNKNSNQHFEYQMPSRYTSSSYHRGGGGNGSGGGGGVGGSNGGVGGGLGFGCDLAEMESCHQCYGLEVEQHCLDFHRLYSECGDRNH